MLRRLPLRYVLGVVVLLAVVSPPAVTSPDGQSAERSGAVRLEGRAFADAAGPWNPLGATLFWALWGEKHDPDRLDRNLAHLSAHGVDYVRILGMVGAPSWEDRTIDPRAPDYWVIAARLFDRLARHGLRAQVTIFADAQIMMEDSADRRAFANTWARFANERRPQVLALEVANEAWQNGFEEEAGVAELRALGRLLAGLTEIPIALSSMPDEQGAWCAAYAGAGVDVATIHYDRDVTRAGGSWRPVRLPWEYPDAYDRECRGQLPRAAINNEPIGPHASVSADADPVRIALAYALTFVAGNAAYVYHHGAGIRGGGAADLGRKRPANLHDGNQAALRALRAMRGLLPPGVASWTRMPGDAPDLPFEGFARARESGAVIGAFAASSDTRLVVVVLGVSRPFTVTTREAMTLTTYDPRSGAPMETLRLAPGDSWSVGPVPPGVVAIGQRQASATVR